MIRKANIRPAYHISLWRFAWLLKKCLIGNQESLSVKKREMLRHLCNEQKHLKNMYKFALMHFDSDYNKQLTQCNTLLLLYERFVRSFAGKTPADLRDRVLEHSSLFQYLGIMLGHYQNHKKKKQSPILATRLYVIGTVIINE